MIVLVSKLSLIGWKLCVFRQRSNFSNFQTENLINKMLWDTKVAEKKISNLGILLINFFSATKKKFYNPFNKSSATLMLPYNSSVKQHLRIMKSFLDTKLVFRYISLSPISFKELSCSPRSGGRSVYSIPYTASPDKYYGEAMKSLNTRIFQHKYNVSRIKRCNSQYHDGPN